MSYIWHVSACGPNVQPLVCVTFWVLVSSLTRPNARCTRWITWLYQYMDSCDIIHQLLVHWVWEQNHINTSKVIIRKGQQPLPSRRGSIRLVMGSVQSLVWSQFQLWLGYTCIGNGAEMPNGSDLLKSTTVIVALYLDPSQGQWGHCYQAPNMHYI